MVLFLLAAARALAYSIRASLVRAGIGLIYKYIFILI
jgi:hypothetical protein